MVYAAATLGALAIAGLIAVWGVIMYLLHYGGVTGPQRHALHAIAQDPFGIITGQFTETILMMVELFGPLFVLFTLAWLWVMERRGGHDD